LVILRKTGITNEKQWTEKKNCFSRNKIRREVWNEIKGVG
jgi:hypothetical protein